MSSLTRGAAGDSLPYPSPSPSQYTAGMSEREPIRVFVTHCFQESDDYLRVFEYLESARNFYYRNCSVPAMPLQGGGQEALREQLRAQITLAEVVIALTSLYPTHQDLLLFELNYAKASDKPVLLLPLFGREQPEGACENERVEAAAKHDHSGEGWLSSIQTTVVSGPFSSEEGT